MADREGPFFTYYPTYIFTILGTPPLKVVVADQITSISIFRVFMLVPFRADKPVMKEFALIQLEHVMLHLQ